MPGPAGPATAAQIAQLNRQARESKDPEQIIGLVEQALQLEPSVKSWVLPTQRDQMKGQLLRKLGFAYRARLKGDRAENIERAIASFEATLLLFPRESAPYDWAETQRGLGGSYVDRIRASRAENLERAIAALESAQGLVTRAAAPDLWASITHGLGGAYANRLRGDKADNLERAIGAFEASLAAISRESHAEQWAGTTLNLGGVYITRKRGDRADNVERAMAALEAALTVYRRETSPRTCGTCGWAGSQYRLGYAYTLRVKGDRADSMERAIAAFEAALSVWQRETLPLEWAEVHHHLGIAYAKRIRGDRSANYERASASFQAALEVRTREAFPRSHLQTADHFGALLTARRERRRAAEVLASARDAFLLLFGEGLDEAEASDLVSRIGQLFSHSAFNAIEIGETEKALQLAVEGRARLLAVALKLQGLELPPAARERLDELRAAIRTETQAYGTARGLDRAAALDRLALLRGELLGMLQSADRSQAEVAGGTLAVAERLVPEGGAIVVPIVTAVGTKVLLLVSSADGHPLRVLDLPELTTARVDKLMRGDGRIGAGGGWLGAFRIQYLPAAELNARIREWTETIGPELWRLFAGRLDAALQERGIRVGARVVWLPTGSLGLLPLGLAQGPKGSPRLGEKYELVTAPSLEALTQAARQVAHSPAASLAAIVNPTGDLPFTEVESALVAAHFARQPRVTLDRATATPQAVLASLKDKSYWHFSSHARFDWENARRAGLVMKDREALTVGALLDAEGSLGRPRLVVLWACETGLYDTSRSPDEFVGLPATFMRLGATGVIGTLWQVDDLATSLLMAKFYDLHLAEGVAPPAALRRAQAWLKQATRDELRVYVRSAAPVAKLDALRTAELENAVATRRWGSPRFQAIARKLQAEEEIAAGPSAPAAQDATGRPPFAHPYYWGGFFYTGL